jgi:hypothetical protein
MLLLGKALTGEASLKVELRNTPKLTPKVNKPVKNRPNFFLIIMICPPKQYCLFSYIVY